MAKKKNNDLFKRLANNTITTEQVKAQEELEKKVVNIDANGEEHEIMLSDEVKRLTSENASLLDKIAEYVEQIDELKSKSCSVTEEKTSNDNDEQTKNLINTLEKNNIDLAQENMRLSIEVLTLKNEITRLNDITKSLYQQLNDRPFIQGKEIPNTSSPFSSSKHVNCFGNNYSSWN